MYKKKKKRDAEVGTGGRECYYRAAKMKAHGYSDDGGTRVKIFPLRVCAGSLCYDGGASGGTRKLSLYLHDARNRMHRRPISVWAAGVPSAGGPHRSACARHASRHPPPNGVRGTSGYRPAAPGATATRETGANFGACACPRVVVTVRVYVCVVRARVV